LTTHREWVSAGGAKEGEYMTQKEAQDKGNRPAANRPCM